MIPIQTTKHLHSLWPFFSFRNSHLLHGEQSKDGGDKMDTWMTGWQYEQWDGWVVYEGWSVCEKRLLYAMMLLWQTSYASSSSSSSSSCFLFVPRPPSSSSSSSSSSSEIKTHSDEYKTKKKKKKNVKHMIMGWLVQNTYPILSENVLM